MRRLSYWQNTMRVNCQSVMTYCLLPNNTQPANQVSWVTPLLLQAREGSLAPHLADILVQAGSAHCSCLREVVEPTSLNQPCTAPELLMHANYQVIHLRLLTWKACAQLEVPSAPGTCACHCLILYTCTPVRTYPPGSVGPGWSGSPN
jgi:hypothetical protein